MEKRFQVFISSTFKDLVEERQAALKAILELNHMPAGMELFPAADDTAWQLIKDVIVASDYYVLIIGGRYGSLDADGISFTEKEYDYAVKIGKPVIPILHKNPDNLARGKTDKDDESWEKLENFRSKIETNHTCGYWESPEELKSKLIIGLTSTAKRQPAIGWVRADQVPTGATISDILKLRQENERLRRQIEAVQTGPPPGTEDLMQGTELFAIRYEFLSSRYGNSSPYPKEKRYRATSEHTWNDIFAAVAPKMIGDTSDEELRLAFNAFFKDWAKKEFENDEVLKGTVLSDFLFQDDQLDTCIVQFRALGLIEESKRKRSLRDTSTYWTLTAFGDSQMVRLRALHRTPRPKRKPSKKAEKSDVVSND